MNRKAVIHLEFPSEKLVKILVKALLPETKKPATSRSRVFVEGEGRLLTLRIEGEDTSAIRSTINSYLRWVVLVRDTYEATEILREDESDAKTLN